MIDLDNLSTLNATPVPMDWH